MRKAEYARLGRRKNPAGVLGKLVHERQLVTLRCHSWSARSRLGPRVGGRDAPVHPMLAGHQLLADQLAAERRTIGMVALDNLVDLFFGVDTPHLELRRQPTQDNLSLLAINRNLF